MRFGVLDSWRGIAALLVALYRFQADGWLFHLPLVRHAALYVDFFFVLSGFVIAHAYFDRLKDRASLGNFLVRRFGRLWPLHFAMFLPFLAFELIRLATGAPDSHGEGVAPFGGYRAPGTIPVELAFLNSVGIYPTTGWNTPSWSISSEFWTYVLFGILCIPARRVMGAVSAVLVIVCLGLIWRFGPGHLDITFAPGTLRCMAGFFAGVLVNLGWRAGQPSLASMRNSLGLAEIPMVIAVFAFVWFAGNQPLSLAAPFVFGAMVFVFAAEAGIVSRLMSGRAFRFVGELSYSIYMVALFVSLVSGRVLVALAGRLGLNVSREIEVLGENWEVFSFATPGVNDALALLYLAGILIASWFTWRFVEKPGRRYFNALADRLTGAPAPQGTGQLP